MKYCVLLLVVGTALGVPILPDAEDVQCNSLFQYKKQYSFSYSGTTETGIIGTDEVTSNTRVTCEEAVVRVPQKCAAVLSLRSCSISPATEQTRAFAQSLEQFELLARVENGLISEVQPHVDESIEALNLKKGILSALQMEFHGRIDEELHSRQLSVHGNCSTRTTHLAPTEENQEDYIVQRDLSSCTHRPTQTPMLWRGISYLQNLNLGESLFNSSQVCRIETVNSASKGQQMQHVVCKEVHSFWPGSISSDRGIKTTITQELGPMTLIRLNSLDFKADRYPKRSTSIVLELPEAAPVERITVDQAMEFIKPLVGSSIDEVKTETPRRFGQWVKALRRLDNATIHEVFERTYNCKDYSEKCRTIPGKAELAREYLWDGLIQCGTLECFAVVNTAIIKDIVPKSLAHIMMYTMAFRDYPTLDIITEGVRLAHVNRTRSVILPISTVIYRYWINNPEIHSERELPAPINEFITLMNDIINNDCTLNSQRGTAEAIEEERQVLLAIKAIGNLGPVAQKYDEQDFKKRAHFERELLRCAVNEDVSFNVSLSAVQAMRRFNMTLVSDFVKTSMKEEILKTKNDDELRIALFLVYMGGDAKAAELRDLYAAIKIEPSKQFRAFALSYIANILESEDPTVQELRKQLAIAIGEEELPDYMKNIFKISRNFEVSKLITVPYFNKTFGGSIQSNLIYNANSVLPRSVMVKLAMNALGKNWEMVESGLEIQGIEVVMESIFGPNGYFPSNILGSVVRKADEAILAKIRSSSISMDWLANALEILMNGIENYQDTINKTTKSVQKKFTDMMKNAEPTPTPEPEPVVENHLPEDVERNLDEMHETVNKVNKEKIAAVYLRLLGNELGYLTLDDLKGLIPALKKQSLVDMYNTISDKLASGVNVDTTRSIVFLERHLVLPTGIGMPLNCSANGTVVLAVRSRGQLALSLPTASISARLAPSASLEIVGAMGVHVPTTKIYTAVVANASIYHNSELEANVSLNGAALKVHLKPVQRSLHLIKAALDYNILLPTGEVHYVHGIMQDAVQYEKCLTTGKYLGATLCLSFAYPNASYVDVAPSFPLTGPIRFALTLDNADESLEGYTFEAKYKKIVKAGAAAKPIKKKGFKNIGKAAAYVAPEEVVDTIVLSFSAPGEELLRNVSTTMTFHRNRTEAKWSFDIPEMDGFRIFAGALNLSDEAGNSGVHFVWNATYKEKDASVSLTLKNSSVVDHTNYTGVFNASIEQLHFASVAQVIKTPDFMIASVNETYYWDDETPLYDQLMFFNGDYAIKHHKYRQAVAYVRSQTKKRVTNSKLYVGALGQELIVDSESFKTRDSYVNEISSKFVNQYIDFPIANLTYQFDDDTRNKVRTTNRYIDIRRGEHALFYQEEAEKAILTNTMTRNYTFGVKSVQRLIRDDFKDIEDPKILAKFSEKQVYDLKPVNLNTTLHFSYVNESDVDCSHFTALNMTVSVPRSRDLTDQTRWGMGYTFRLINESVTDEKSLGYVFQFNQTIPILLLDFSNEISVRNTSKGLNVSFSHQSMERKYGKRVNLHVYDNVDLNNMAMQNGINFTSPYYNYSGSFQVLMDEFHGLVVKNVMEQKGGVVPNITDFLHDYYVTVKLWKNATAGFQITNKLFNVSTNHLISLDGPVTEFEIKQVPFWLRDFLNKTINMDLIAAVDCIREVSYKIGNSSMTVGNDLVVKMPYTFNVTMEHFLFVDMSRVNHTIVALVKRPGVNFAADYRLVGPAEDTGFYTVSSEVTGNVGTFTDLRSTVTGKAKWGKSLNSNLVMTTTWKVPTIMNVTGGFTHTIKGLKSATKFESVQWRVTEEMESILGTSNVVTFAKFDTFKKLFKFSKAEVGMTTNVLSRYAEMTWATGAEASGFVDIWEFSRVNVSSTANIMCPLVNATMASVHEVNNLNPNMVVGSMVSSNSYDVVSVLGNAQSTFGWEVMEFQSPLDFQRSNGSSTFTVTSKLINMTTSDVMEFVGVRGLFTFEKVNGEMNWNIVTILGTVSITPMVEMKNFVNISLFESATAGANVVMSNDYVGSTTFMGKMGVYDMSGLLVLEEANITVDARIGTPWLDASLDTAGKVKRMNGLFRNKAIIGKTRYSTTSRLLNVTGDMSSETKNMDGIVNFDTMTNMWTHTDESPITSFQFDMMSELSGVSGILTFALFSNNIGYNWTTPLGTVETNFVYFRENSQGLATFDMANINMKTGFKSRLFNTTMEASSVGDGFESFFVFREFTTGAFVKISVAELFTMTAGHSSATTGSNSITSFGRFIMNNNATVTTPIVTMNMMQDTEMINWQSFFTYDRFVCTNTAEMVSTLVNSTGSWGVEIQNRRGLFAFDRANVNGLVSVVSKFLTTEMTGSIVGRGFESFFVFRKWATTADVRMDLLEKVVVTAGHSASTTDGTSITSLGRFIMNNNATVTAPMVTMEMVQDMTLTNWRTLFEYDRFTTTNTASVVSMLVNSTGSWNMDIKNQRGLFAFDKVDINGNSAVTSTILTSRVGGSMFADAFESFSVFREFTTRASVDMNVWKIVEITAGHIASTTDCTSLTTFGRFTTNNNAALTTPVTTMDWTQEMDLVNARGLCMYDQLTAFSNARMVSTLMNVTSATVIDIEGMDGFFTFDSTKYGMSTNWTTPIAVVKNDIGFEVLEMVTLTQSTRIGAGVTTTVISDFGTIDTAAGFKVLGQRALFAFDHIGVGANMTVASQFVNVSFAIGSKVESSDGLFEYGLFKTGYSGSINATISSMKVEGGLEVLDQTGLFAIRKATMGAMATLTNCLVNVTVGMETLLQNQEKFMYFDTVSHNASVNLVTKYQTMEHGYHMSTRNSRGPFVSEIAQIFYEGTNKGVFNSTSVLTVVLNNNNGFAVFDSLEMTHGMEMESMIVNGTTTSGLNINEATGPLAFREATAKSATMIDTPLGSSGMEHTLELTRFRGPMDFDAVSVISTGNVTSLAANATVNFMYTLDEMSGFMRFAKMVVMGNSTATTVAGELATASTVTVTNMEGPMKVDVFKVRHDTQVTSPLSTLDLSGNFLLRKMLNITSFKLLNSGYNLKLTSLPMNLTSGGELRVEAANNLFDVALIDGSMVTNVSTPIVSHNSTSVMVVRAMTCLREFGDISITNEMRTVTPLTDSLVAFTLGGETGWASVEQRLDTTLTTPAGAVELAQFIDYENAKISLTLPEYAYVHFHGHLNEIGDELTLKIKHCLEDQDLVEDLSLLVKLNESNIVYTNFSWNPEVVAELMEISVDALNRTVNYTLTLFSNTKEAIKELNATLFEFIENPREFIQEYLDLATSYDDLVEKVDELVKKVKDLVKSTLEDPKQAIKDFYAALKTSLKEAKMLVEEILEKAKIITEDTFEVLDQQFVLREKIDRLNATVQELIRNISNPRETWEYIKPQLEEYLEKVKEQLMYQLIADTFYEIVDVPRIEETLREYAAKVNPENIQAQYVDLKLLINTEKVQEFYDSIMAVDVNVGCVTFKDLRNIDKDRVDRAYEQIKEFLAVENLEEFINVAKVEEIADRINQTIRENMDIEVWNQTIRTYINFPVLKASMVSVKDFAIRKANETLQSIKEEALIKSEELMVKYEELKEIIMESVQLLEDTLVEVSGLNWRQLKRRVRVILEDFKDDLDEKVTEIEANLEEQVLYRKVKELLVELKENVTSKIDMTRINEAVDQLNKTVCMIIDITKNESHPINLIPMRFVEATIYELYISGFEKVSEYSSFEKVSEYADEYGEVAFELIKEYGQEVKEFYDTYKPIVEEKYEEYYAIVEAKFEEVYNNATEMYDIYMEKAKEFATELAANVTEKAEELRVQLEERLVEFNKTMWELYEENSPLIYEFVMNVTEMSMDLTRNVTAYVVEISEPLVESSLEFLEPHTVQILDRLATFKEDSLIFSEDVCINITSFVEQTIEKLPEYKQQLLDLSEEYRVIVEDFYQEFKENVTIFKEEAVVYLEDLKVRVSEFSNDTWAEVIAIAKNEENLLNYYPTEWTGKTVHVLVNETLDYLIARTEELREMVESTLANPEHSFNRIPMEFLEMTIMEIYDQVKENVTMLIEDGKDYVEVAKVFIEESIISLNETRLEYNITVEHLQDLIREYVDSSNATLQDFLNWVEVAKQQPYKRTLKQVIRKVNETYIDVLDSAQEILVKSIDLANRTVEVSLELWNNLTRQENLDRIPVILEDTYDFIAETLVKINQTVYDTVDVTKRVLEILKEESGFPEKFDEYKALLEEYKAKLEEYRAKLEEKVEEYRPMIEEYITETKDKVEEFLSLTKEAVFDRSMSYVEYLNNTLPGWMYRYYRVDALPYEMYNSTVVFIRDVAGRFVELNLDHNSVTVNFTHPFHWTSFRELPRLTEAQMDTIAVTWDELMQRVIFPGQYQVERISDIIVLRYAELSDYISVKIDENPQVKAKLDELRAQIEETRRQIEAMRADFTWTEFGQNVSEQYQIAKEYLQENAPIFYEQLKENATILATQLKENATVLASQLKENATVIIEQLKENVTYWMEYIKENYPEFAEELKVNVTRIANQLKENATDIAKQLKEDYVYWVQEIKENYPEYFEKVKELGKNITDAVLRLKDEFPEISRDLLQKLSALIRDIHLPKDLPPLIKPWTYKAMIFGNRHVMTFDKMVYEHPGYTAEGCTYLLAKDFVDRNFTILVNERTTTLHVKDSFSIEVNDEMEFFINGDGTPASPPYETANRDLVIRRDGPWLNISTTYGINMFCHKDQYMCVYELSGWYYHKTRGLLGNLDTEAHNEMILPDGTITENVNEWMNSYEVTGDRACQIPLDFQPSPANCAASEKKAIKARCQAVFNSTDSPLNPIREVVCSKFFLKNCLEVEAENCRDVKVLTDSYRTVGALEGVFVNLTDCANPDLAVPCIYDRPAVSPADIVFIISESWRMLDDVSEEQLKDNLKSLYVSIRTNYPDSNFALVAYAGPEEEHCGPHLHSNEMEFFSGTHFERAIDSLDFCEVEENCHCSSRKGDALRAIEFASHLTLRDNAGKIFILIDNFEKDYSESQRLAAADILQNNTITFNSISTYRQLQKTIGKVPIIGVNYNGQVLFNKRNSAETITEALDIPKGVFAKLATATDGAMMGYNYILDEVLSLDVKQVLKKLFRTQLVAYSEKEIQCRSVWSIYGQPSSRCTVV